MICYPSKLDVPVLRRTMPQLVRSLHQIELTSRCNLRCVYCPSRKMPRFGEAQEFSTDGKEWEYRFQLDMSEEHYLAALRHVRFYAHSSTRAQRDVNLAGIGESTLHPEFVRFVHLAREAIGEDGRVILATNGLTMTREMAMELARARAMVWVSLHRPEKATHAIEYLREAGALSGVSNDPSTNSNDWAGQVDWYRNAPGVMACQWMREALAFALSDGRISACCLDAKGAGVIGHVDDPLGTLRTRPYSLCSTCHQVIAIEGVRQ